MSQRAVIARQSSTVAPKKRHRLRSEEEALKAQIIDRGTEDEPPRRQQLLEQKESEDVSMGRRGDDEMLESSNFEGNGPNLGNVDDGMINVTVEEHEEAVDYGDEEPDEAKEDVGEGEELVGYEHDEEVIDGDEEEEHHVVVKERRRRKEFEVFVGGLDRDAVEEDLLDVFSKVGDITEVRLMKNPLTRKNKGFAFIQFATTEQAKRAVNELKSTMVNGKQCGVFPSQDSDTLFIGNVCKTWTKEAFKEKLAKYGVNNFEDLTLVEDIKNTGMNRGFAFLDFPSRADALDACKHLQKMHVVFGTDRLAKVAFADTFIEPDDEIMAQVKKVFIDGLHSAWDEDCVRKHVGKFGRIEFIELARNMPAAKRTDFGFVTFETHDAAVACIEGINNTELVDGDNKVKVWARLTRPRHRCRLGNHGRGGYSVGRGSRGDARTSRSSGMGFITSRRYSTHGGQDRQYDGDFKHSHGPQGRYTTINSDPDRVESRRTWTSPQRTISRRSPGPAYRKGTSKREHIYPDEQLTGRVDFVSRVPAERHLSSRDVYPSRDSVYMDNHSKSGSRSAAYKPPPRHAKESHERHMDQSLSYLDNNSRDYGSGLKRPYSLVEEFHSDYIEVEPMHRQPRDHRDYKWTDVDAAYSETTYGRESARLGQDSHIKYDGDRRSSIGHSRGYNALMPSTSYARDDMIRGESGRSYSSFDRDYNSRDYTSSETYGGTNEYSSLYSSRGMKNGYPDSRRPRPYY
ncbi:hypothetical protein Syun_004826 [Stephania yunnanensis]|uniref:RRM domain-containing protein n=1 Tax=Stephania yunnanensis TaxID=152371 RepID=A0AAP0L734_9MAGN